MKLTKKTCKLIAEIEDIIGGSCYNPKSYNGWTHEYGAYFRYPVTVHDKKNGDVSSTKYKLDNIDKDNLSGIYYAFGANRLRIGVAIVRVLEYLENYYGLDFNEMKKATKAKSEEQQVP